MKENICLRCYSCNYEFQKEIDTQDKIYELDCPKCNKQKVEINIGKKVKENDKTI